MRGSKYLIFIILLASMTFTGCINRSNDEEVVERKGITIDNPNLSICVSNQCGYNFDPIHLLIFLDNKVVVNDEFIADEHRIITYQFNISFGEHSILIHSQRDNYYHYENFTITRPIWGLVNYWGNSSSRKPIKFRILNGPPSIN